MTPETGVHIESTSAMSAATGEPLKKRLFEKRSEVVAFLVIGALGLFAIGEFIFNTATFKETANQFIGSPYGATLYVCTGIGVFLLSLVFYRVWTKPIIAFEILVLFTAMVGLSMTDKNFFAIVGKPDNVPIVGLIYLLGFFTWWAFRQAAINDERLEKGLPPTEALETNDRVLVWPDLVYEELISLVILTVVLIVWSLGLRAPLEEPANTARTPNPSKAPWYFLGLQEMLVYFDPWLAGVVFPSMIISGLCILPYIDKNPRGVGYYTIKERTFAVSVFLFGFIVMWVSLIILGTFLRGANWNIFGPYEHWDVHKVEPLTNVNLSHLFWVKWFHVYLPTAPFVRELPGIILFLGYFLVLPPILAGTVFKKIFKEMGFIRYNLMMIHLLVMASLLIKMITRWTLNLKYILDLSEYIPGFRI